MTIIEKLSANFIERSPQTAVGILENFSIPELAEFLRQIPPRCAALVLETTTPAIACDCLLEFSEDEIGPILNETTVAGGAALLRLLRNEKKTSFLETMEEDKRNEIMLKLQFPENTAGAEMDARHPALRQNHRVKDLVAQLRNRKDSSYACIFVLDRNLTPAGIARAEDILISEPDRKLSSIALPCASVIPSMTDCGVLENNPEMKTFHALPVVDEANRYIGAITEATVINSIKKAKGMPEPGGLKRTSLALGEIYRLGLSELIDALNALKTSSMETPPKKEEYV